LTIVFIFFVAFTLFSLAGLTSLSLRLGGIALEIQILWRASVFVLR